MDFDSHSRICVDGFFILSFIRQHKKEVTKENSLVTSNYN